MTKIKSTEEILDFAIKNEEASVALYTDLAKKMERPAMRKVFESFAKEEKGHKEKLLKIKKGESIERFGNKVIDLKIGDYLVEEEPTPDMNYQQALILAMKKEKAAFRLYTDLAEKAEDEGLRSLLTDLAQEEAKHKLRFEVEYDEHILQWN